MRMMRSSTALLRHASAILRFVEALLPARLDSRMGREVLA
jgi:hypothetical protein